MDLVHCPESSHLVAGPVEPVVAAVQQEGCEEPGGGPGPGQAGQAVVLVEVGVAVHHQHPGHQARQRHQQPARDARHTAQHSQETVSHRHIINHHPALTCQPSSEVCPSQND